MAADFAIRMYHAFAWKLPAAKVSVGSSLRSYLVTCLKTHCFACEPLSI